MGAILRRLDAYQRRRPWAGFPFAVVKKFSEDQAGNLAALVAYYAFFSVFPLLLAMSTILGFVLAGHPAWQHSIEHSAFAQLPLISDKSQPAPLHGSIPALVVGLALALWSGLGVAKTAQTAFNTVYLVAHTDRPNFLRSTLRALGLVVVGGLGLMVTTALSSAVTSVHTIAGVQVGIGLRVIGTALAIGLNAALFLVLFRWLTVRHVPWRNSLPGALISAVALQTLQLAATAFIDHKLKGASSTYGKNFGTVVVMLSWFYLQAQVVLLAVEVNVVRQYGLWPRALTDPPATEADFRAYEAYAERERFQPEEGVDTEFGGEPNPVDQPTATSQPQRRIEVQTIRTVDPYPHEPATEDSEAKPRGLLARLRRR
jgi:membrane protein